MANTKVVWAWQTLRWFGHGKPLGGVEIGKLEVVQTLANPYVVWVLENHPSGGLGTRKPSSNVDIGKPSGGMDIGKPSGGVDTSKLEVVWTLAKPQVVWVLAN